MSEAAAPVVFYSYSHKDEPLKDKLDAHLSGLQRAGLITSWHDRRIAPGEDWAGAIDNHMARADIILLLISADFLASDYCWGVEVDTALKRHARGEVTVVPVIIRPVEWQSTPLGRLKVLPKDGRAVTSWSNRDEAWADVAKGVRLLSQALQGNFAVPAIRSPIEFAHLGVLDSARPRWKEYDHSGQCEFGRGCETLFKLEEFVTNADMFVDVVVLNNSRSPVVLSAVGVEIIEVMQVVYVYGIPKPAKIAPPTDVYEITMPNLRKGYPSRNAPRGPVMELNQQVSKRLVDPIYLPARAPYRYVLRLKDYQRNMPNHTRLRLTAEVRQELVRSQLLHVFTW